MKIKMFLIVTIIISILFACGEKQEKSNQQVFSIISGSENETLEPIIEEFEKINNIDVQMHYKGSVDIMMELQEPVIPYDAVWPANSLWITLGDNQFRVKHIKSIMTSPVVFGIKKSLAEKLGFVGKDVKVMDILKAINEDKLNFMMTSATQSNSGASAYMGFLYALSGNPEVLQIEDLQKSELKKNIKDLLSGIHRSSGSSGWLKDLFLQGNYNAMVNYEALMIETNKELIRQGKEPLYIVYPVDGIVLADSPLGYVNKGDMKKEEIFTKLQNYLLSPESQKLLLKQGRRTGFGGTIENPDKTIFNPDWGINTEKILSPIRMPSSKVIFEALRLYQTEFRKPSYTVFCLDFSGSMRNRGETELKRAVEMLLNQDIAKKYFIQNSSEDITEIIAFSDQILKKWKIRGGDQEEMLRILNEIKNFNPNGGTDIYTPVIEGLGEVTSEITEKYIPAVILMTDGQSNSGKNFRDLSQIWYEMNIDVPVFSILFGQASKTQLDQIAVLTRGKIFDGRTDLVKAFRKAKGYN